MTHRREDIGIVELLRNMDSRMSVLETGQGIRSNDMRIGDWLFTVDDNGCVICINIKTGLRTSSCDCDCSPSEPVLSLTGPYILYDTRSWSGGLTLPNEGLLGSDLDANIGNGLLSGVNRTHVSKSQTFGAGKGWAAMIGGAPDTDAITFVCSFADTMQVIGSSPDEFYQASVGSFQFNQSPLSLQNLSLFVKRANNQYTVQLTWSHAPTVDPEPLVGLYHNLEVNAAAERQPNDGVIVVTLDMGAGTADIWLNGISFSSVPPVSLGAEGFFIHGIPFSEGSATAATFVVEMGDDYTLPTSGPFNQGVKIMAMYRGYPSTTDLAILQDLYS